MTVLSDGDRVHLVDRKGRQYAFTLKAGDTFQLSGETLAHDDLIGKPDGTLVTLSRGRRMLALRPTLSEYVLKMPRGAQVLYPKDLGVILDRPEPWQVVLHAVTALRSGGVYLSYVPTIPQVMQTVEALHRAQVFAMIQTFETLLRTWNIEGRSVRPDLRMVAHSGFLTVARKVQPGLAPSVRYAEADPEAGEAGPHEEGL